MSVELIVGISILFGLVGLFGVDLLPAWERLRFGRPPRPRELPFAETVAANERAALAALTPNDVAWLLVQGWDPPHEVTQREAQREAERSFAEAAKLYGTRRAVDARAKLMSAGILPPPLYGGFDPVPWSVATENSALLSPACPTSRPATSRTSSRSSASTRSSTRRETASAPAYTFDAPACTTE